MVAAGSGLTGGLLLLDGGVVATPSIEGGGEGSSMEGT
jgi:hypothetical protein